MSCYGCTTKFSLFTKEVTCSNCSLSFCAKCIKQKTIDKRKICVNCFKVSDVTKPINDETEPPALLLKRLESMEDPSRPPVTMYTTNNRLDNLKRGLSYKDVELLNRLEKLKQPKTAVPSESEIKARLLSLQEKAPETSTSKAAANLYQPKKSNVEQVDDLLVEYMESAQLDTQSDIDSIEQRLAALKYANPRKESEMVCDIESEDEASAVLKIVKRAVDESKLPRTEVLTPPDSEPEESELPWCEMCNGDATVRCLSCDGALYCARCLKEGHDYFDFKNHKTVPIGGEKANN